MRFTRVACIAGCFLGAVSFSFAQTSASFKPYTSTDGETPANIYTADLNNDGITDIIQDTGQSPPGFTVSLGNGDGTFKAPVLYTVSESSRIGIEPLVTGDFNGDGKVDVAAVLSSNQVAVYLGNGDGTLRSPIVSTISLPSGWGFGSGGAVAADFNGDGKIDLAAWTSNWVSGSQPGTSALYVMEGNGAGGFSNPHLVFSGPRPENDFQVFAGDFDADGKTDLVATDYTLDSEGTNLNTEVHVCYGNNSFGFDCTVPYTAAHDPLYIGVGDLNSDGISDIYGLNGIGPGQQMGVFYGETSRTFKSYFTDPASAYPIDGGTEGPEYISQFAVADFNGDGRMDLVAAGWNSSYSTQYLMFFLAGTTPGQFTEQEVALPVTDREGSNPVAGLFGSSRLSPDVAYNHSPNYGSPPQNKPSYLLAEVNQDHGWFGPCTYPHKAEGFNVCAAGTNSGSTANFRAAANSFGEMRKIELWVDGKKVLEQWHTWDHHAFFHWAGSFPAGTHQATFYAADVDNRLQRYDFSFTVGGSACAAPSTPGVNVCSPVNNSTDNSPVRALAAARISGTLARMEVWVDGVKKYTETSGLTLSTSIALGAGKHRFDFYAVNTAGTKWEKTVYATVP